VLFMEIQTAISEAAEELFNQFEVRPFDFFNERDSISRFLAILRRKHPEIWESQINHSDQIFSLLHEEYPIPTFVESTNPGRYDIVILNEDYIKGNSDYNLSRPGQDREVYLPPTGIAFKAVIEFKFLYESPGRIDAIEQDLNKLDKVSKHTEYCCFIYMQRLLRNVERWNDHVMAVRKMAGELNVDSYIKSVSPNWREK
jgi:hypothetical protein